MTRKDFQAIAHAMDVAGQAFPPFNDEREAGEYVAWVRCCNSLADVCALSKPNFDRARFRKACGMEITK
jgi:hypothetical protein